MASVQEVRVPDIGDFKDVPVIEVLVKPGDRVEVDAPLVTLESDKATMEVPSPAAGVVRDIKVKVGDKVSQGVLVLTLEEQAAGPKPEKKSEPPVKKEEPANKEAPAAPAPPTP